MKKVIYKKLMNVQVYGHGSILIVMVQQLTQDYLVILFLMMLILDIMKVKQFFII